MSAVGILEAVVLLAAAVQAARLAAQPFFRLEATVNPARITLLLGFAAAVGALALEVVLRWPPARHVAAAVVAVVMLGAWWRARPTYGRRWRLPPGSLGLRHALGAISNRRFYLEQAARFGPVFKVSEFGRPVVCIVGLDRIRAVLSEHGASLAGADFWKRYKRLIPGGLLRQMDPEPHKASAPMFRTAFGALALDRAEPLIRLMCRSALYRLAADSARNPEGASGRQYFQRAALETVGYLFYGLSPGDPRLDELDSWMPSLLTAADWKSGWRRKTQRALAGVTHIMRGIQSEWLTRSGIGTPSALRTLVTANPNALDHPTNRGNFIVISRIAYGDLTGLLDWIFKFLCDDPSMVAPVRAHLGATGPAQGTMPDPGTRIVMETLRLEQSEYLYRRVSRSFEFEGMFIPAGWQLRCCTNESHRDPAVFPEPDRFDPERFARRTYSRIEYAPFGADAHACLGAHIAHFLGRLFVEELALGFDWRPVSDGPPESGNRHRNHWMPSDRLRVVMTPRAGARASGEAA